MPHATIVQPYGVIYSQPVTAVDLWQIPLRQPAEQREQLASFLSHDEQERAARFHFERDRCAYQVARGVMRLLLAAYLEMKPTAVPIAYTTYHKPYLAPPHNRLKFNLSHTGEWALLAVCWEREVGVDIEQIRPLPELAELAERFFSPAEREALRALHPEQKARAFFNCWTRKEAFIKALGSGLYQPLDSFDVTLRPNEPAHLLRVEGDPAAVDNWRLHEIDAPAGYAAALFVGRKENGTQIFTDEHG
jgi:4'-phosphopantetheinyl transferase